MSQQRRRVRLGYSFTPTCKHAIRAVAQGMLDAQDYVLLAFFYDRMNFLTRKVDVTLEQMVAGTRWRSTPDALYRRFVGLRNDGWIDYTSVPGQHAHGYVVTLLPKPRVDGKNATEDAPRSPQARQPSRRRVAMRLEKASGPASALRGSEEQAERSAPVDPKKGGARPRRPSPPSPVAKPIPDPTDDSTVRGAQSVRGEAGFEGGKEDQANDEEEAPTTDRKGEDRSRRPWAYYDPARAEGGRE